MNLADFVSARLDEDESKARAAGERVGPQWLVHFDDHDELGEYRAVRDEDARLVVEPGEVTDEYQAAHIARHDPARVPAEVQAKRRIVELAREAEASATTSAAYQAAEDYMSCVLRELASVYADHPEYREEWRP